MTGARLVLALVALAALFLAQGERAHASAFGEENITLVKQLTELMEIRREAQQISDGVLTAVELGEDMWGLYRAAQAGWEEVWRYTTDDFIRDFKKDLYNHYPGFEILIEGKESRRLQRWGKGRSRSPFKTYELLSAVFADATDPLLKRRAAEEFALLSLTEAAGAISLANDAEAWTEDADKSAASLAKVAFDESLTPAQAQMVTAKALAIIAVQQSHTVRLLSRSVRLDGVNAAFEYNRRMQQVGNQRRFGDEARSYFRHVDTPPALMQFDRAW